MKKLYALMACTAIQFQISYAQPQITDGSNMVKPGFMSSVLMVTNVTDAGNAGAGVTWDFSTLTPSAYGTYKVVTPSTTPYASTYPTANFAAIMTVNDTDYYFYSNILATKFEQVTYDMTKPGTGADLSKNPSTELVFPFIFGASVTDTFQPANGGPTKESLDYDGYGTLITPNNSYDTVIRIKRLELGRITYSWYTLSPLRQVALFINSTSTMYLYENSKSGINQEHHLNSEVLMYPNPIHDLLHIDIKDYNFKGTMQLSVVNNLGQIIKQMAINSLNTSMVLNDLNSGIYFYTLTSEGQLIDKGKMVKE